MGSKPTVTSSSGSGDTIGKTHTVVGDLVTRGLV
jgi:hypothetical protein